MEEEIDEVNGRSFQSIDILFVVVVVERRVRRWRESKELCCMMIVKYFKVVQQN